ncbi:hypothetical protein GH714_012077 [Hevea brasiliensis]|uniref:Disease resistance protein At4g27190-like leucine-rich repeats domain-containing protein n=1 Tax=Hevea brasiliensis TaxID=3981 RepID=A0A6A6L1A0_HEVBR|nr:hypothetical protein GH714_012077 [Hevea brasiliensis]
MKKAPPGIESRHKQILTADEPAFEEFLSEELSLFNRMVSFPNLEDLRLDSVTCEKIWHDQLSATYSNLKSLSVTVATIEVTFSNLEKLNLREMNDMKKRFQRLEKLNVDNCFSLQEIYQLEGFNVIEAFELRKLSIQSLPSLKHVWRKDPQGVFTFKNLKSVEVSNCDVLKNLFPASIAESLLQLENLTIIECGVEEIVAKPEVEPAPYYCFKFPQLTSLKLIKLSELRSFYPGTHISEWQKLKRLNVRNCRKMSPNLEELTLEHKDLIAIQHAQFSFQHFSKLKVLTLSNLQNRSQLFLIGFLKTVHYVETIVVESSNLEELFSCEGFTPVRNLELFVVDNLKQIWDQDSRLKPVFQHLETLSVNSCNSLTNIVPSSSFLNLATLEVSSCEGLVNLITASTAKTMVQLTKMTVHNCNKMTEIVTSDGDDHTEDEIIFSKLQILELICLSSLVNFCSGNHALNFPSLENVKVNGCLQMKIFSFGVLNTPKLRGIELAAQQHWEGNLNATIESNLSMTYFQASKFPALWHDGNQGRLFHNVQSLTVDQCAISDIPVPANLLQFLNKLEKLQVEYCDSAEIVFDLEGLSVDDGHTELLPQLTLCLMQLEEIKLSNCNTIEEIIEKEGPEEATSSADKMILPSLKFVDLECLPKFSSFYSGSTLQLSYAERKMAWPISIQELEALAKVSGGRLCFFSNAVSSNLLKYLFLSNQPVISYPKSENELVVERCDSVEELFDLEGLNADEGDVGLLKYLNELRLIDLPRLRHVWNNDPQGILSFKNLTLLQVQNCSSLTNIFTLSMASGLVNLQHMELKRCILVEHNHTKKQTRK